MYKEKKDVPFALRSYVAAGAYRCRAIEGVAEDPAGAGWARPEEAGARGRLPPAVLAFECVLF